MALRGRRNAGMNRLVATFVLLLVPTMVLVACRPRPFAAAEPLTPDTASVEDPQPAATPGAAPGAMKKPEYETLTIRGRVDFLAAALQRRYGVKSVPEAAERQLALDDPQGELYPLVEDVRGRAFRVDPRLRERDVELLVRRYKGSPLVQIIQVFSLKSDGKYELDYWCDICSIAMYELKACDCCQAENRLRERLVNGAK